MAAYDSLKSLVQQAIRTNGNNEITGQVLQNVLMAMIDELGGENGYAGVATPSTNPGATDGKVFYFATEAGTYTHFDGATLAKGIHLLVFNGVTWSHQTLYTIDSEVTSGSNNLITSGAVYTKIINAINALNATVSKSAGADGLSLSLTETGGKVTNISGSIAPQTYDAYGAASAAQIAAATDATNKVNAAKTQILGDAASDYNTLGKLEDKIQAEASRAAAAESALNTAKADKATTLAGYGINDAYTKTEVNGLVSTPHQNYVTVPTYASLPATGSADTIYRVSNYNGSTIQVDASVYSEYAWNGSGYTFLRVVSQIGEVFDITVYNSNTKYADLAAALGTNGANVPSSIRRGGMSVKFVQSSDNKYVQYRCISNTFTIDTTQWAIYSNEVYISNPEFIAVWTDKDKKIFIAVENDGNVIFGAGVPRQIIDYVTEKIAELSLDEYEDIVSFLGGLIEGDKTLQNLLNEKVDKEEGKSLIPTQYIQEIDNPEFIGIFTDNNGKILLGIEKNGNILFGAGVPSQILGYFNEFYKELKQDINTLNSDVEDLQSLVSSDKVLSTHMDKESMLYSMSFNMPFYYYKASATPSAAKKKRLVFAWLSDIHGFGENYGRFVKYANNYKDVIDFMLVTGDISALEPNDGGWRDTQETYAPNSEVPILICLGNHDVTNNSGNGVFYDSLEDMDAELITPWATQIGWTNKGNGSYYYKDFVKNSYKYRFIVLNDYERPRLVADGSWETITYDSFLPAYNPATSYVAGDKVNLDSHSYQAVKSVSNVSPTRTYYDKIDGRYITEQQALWLCDALNSMPDGYQAVICTHQKVGAVTVQSGKFTSRFGTGSGGFQMCQDGDLIVDVIKAFTNRTAINKKYEMTQRGNNAGGEVISGFDFTLVYDFSNSVSSTSKIKCCLTGHTHSDEVSKINNLGFDLYDITLKNGGATFQCDDMPNFGERSKDAFNIVSVDGNLGFKMMRIGQDINDRFELRDNIIINI